MQYRYNKDTALGFFIAIFLFIAEEILFLHTHFDDVDVVYFVLTLPLLCLLVWELICALRKFVIDENGITIIWLECIPVYYKWEDFVCMGYVYAKVPRMGKMKCYICSTKPIVNRKEKLHEFAWYGQRVKSIIAVREDNKLSELLREECPYDEIFMPLSKKN